MPGPTINQMNHTDGALDGCGPKHTMTRAQVTQDLVYSCFYRAMTAPYDPSDTDMAMGRENDPLQPPERSEPNTVGSDSHWHSHTRQ